MSISTLSPSPQTTMVILLGASKWPNAPEFTSSIAFMNAAMGIKNYFLSSKWFALPPENLLDLFDSYENASELLEQIDSFIEHQSLAMKAIEQAPKDILVYFVGHGGFVGHDAEFYLVHRRTRMKSLRASGIDITALADILLDKARHIRRYIILDCCFAAAAFRAFQGGPDQVAIQKTLHAFEVKTQHSGFPRKGTTLLCSSDQKTPSLLLPDDSSTMFSKALLDVLIQSHPNYREPLSLREVGNLAADILFDMPTRNAPRPIVHSPDQSEGDVADVPFFPSTDNDISHLPLSSNSSTVEALSLIKKEIPEIVPNEGTTDTTTHSNIHKLTSSAITTKNNHPSLNDYLQETEDILSSGQIDDAIARLQRVLISFPESLEIQRLLGKVYLALGRLEDARQAFDWILTNDPENVVVFCDRALVSERLLDLDTALDCYQQAYELSRGNRSIRQQFNTLSTKAGQKGFMFSSAGLARLYMRGKLLFQAIQEWEKILAVTPYRLDAKIGLLETHWLEGSYDLAEQLANQILNETPDCLKALLLLAHVSYDKDEQKARELIQHADLLDPEQVMAKELFMELTDDQSPFLSLIRKTPVILPEMNDAFTFGKDENTSRKDGIAIQIPSNKHVQDLEHLSDSAQPIDTNKIQPFSLSKAAHSTGHTYKSDA